MERDRSMTSNGHQSSVPNVELRETAAIELFRTVTWAGHLDPYTIRVDGKRAANINAGVTKTILVDPGSHEIAMRHEWYRSNRVQVDLEAGETFRMVCGSSITGWRIAFWFIWLILLPHKAIWLREVKS